VAEKVKGSPPFVVDYLEIKKPSQLTEARRKMLDRQVSLL
jgi:hypothetical protein